jgi:hypothetical protein
MLVKGMYFFNVESLIFFFWTFMLFISVWEARSKALKSYLFVAGTKWVSFVLPGIQIATLYVPAVQARPIVHAAIGNGICKDTPRYPAGFPS